MNRWAIVGRPCRGFGGWTLSYTSLHHTTVTTKRRKLIAFVLLALIGGVIAYSLLRQDDEPTYEGRRLSEWFDPVSTTHGRTVMLFIHFFHHDSRIGVLVLTRTSKPSLRMLSLIS